MQSKTFELDLSEIVLHGWHKWRLTSWVDEYRELIRQDMVAPPVPVVYIGKDELEREVYTLDYKAMVDDGEGGILDGGHRRAKSHLLEGKPLPCYFREGATAVPLEKRVKINDMELLDKFPSDLY